MLRFIALLAVIAGTVASSTEPGTGWLASSHPRVRIMFDMTLRPECRADCERYDLLLAYRSSVPPAANELAEWRSFAEAGCVDLLLPGRKSFACREPGALAGTSKNGQQFATSRFRIKRADLEGLLAPSATVRIQSLTLRLPAETRATLKEFLSGPIL